MIFTAFITMLAAVNAAPTSIIGNNCNHVMKANGLSERFPGAVAHGIHSITLEDIRYYFKKNASEKNNVPTVNYDLTDEQLVLPHAKMYGYDTSFYTMGMRHLDQVLRDMDKKDWYLANYNPLEKLAHTIHMHEVWAKTKVHYESIYLQKISKEVCACVTDTKNNGVLQMLPFMALKIRYPGLTSDKAIKINGGVANWHGNLYRYHFINEWSDELKSIDFSKSVKEIKDEVSSKINDGDDAMQHLTDEKAWLKWKSGINEMNERDNYELAMFLYCTLNNYSRQEK